MGTHYQGTKAEKIALCAHINLIRAAESVMSRIEHIFSQYGLTESQFGVLEVLLHLGPLCQRELGQKILKSSGNITMVVDNLEKQGLVVRQRDSPSAYSKLTPEPPEAKLDAAPLTFPHASRCGPRGRIVRPPETQAPKPGTLRSRTR